MTTPRTRQQTSGQRSWTSRRIRRRRTDAVRTVGITVVTLLLAALLNARALATTAASQPPGWQRDLATAITEPLATASRTLYLDRPRALLERTLDREPAPVAAPTVAPAPPGRSQPTPTAGRPTAPPPEGPSPSTDPTPPPTQQPTATPSPSTPTQPALIATAEQPASLWIVGDSMTETFGPALANAALAAGVLEPSRELQYSSGLTRPDFYNWPARLGQRLDQDRVDIVVFMIGANDGQPILTDGTWVDFDTPAWTAEYRLRTEHTANILSAGARTVYWIGQPIARSASYSHKMQTLNTIYEDVAATHPTIRFIPTWDLFSTPDGSYSPYLPDNNGHQTLMRRTDGIHLTTAGGQHLARHVIHAIANDWEFDP